MPDGATGLWLNADVNWRSVPREGSTEPPSGGCDEGCNGYVAAELWVCADDDDKNKCAVLAGYGAKDSDVLMNVDGIELPLTWANGSRGMAADLSLVAGQRVQIRFYSREADLYAFGVSF